MFQFLSDLIKVQDMFGYNVLGYRFVLTIDMVHLKLSFVPLHNLAQFWWRFQRSLQRFQKETSQNSLIAIQYFIDDNVTYSRCHSYIASIFPNTIRSLPPFRSSGKGISLFKFRISAMYLEQNHSN